MVHFRTMRVTGTQTVTFEYDEEVRVPASMSNEEAEEHVRYMTADVGCSIRFGDLHPDISDSDGELTVTAVKDEDETDEVDRLAMAQTLSDSLAMGEAISASR